MPTLYKQVLPGHRVISQARKDYAHVSNGTVVCSGVRRSISASCNKQLVHRRHRSPCVCVLKCIYPLGRRGFYWLTFQYGALHSLFSTCEEGAGGAVWHFGSRLHRKLKCSAIEWCSANFRHDSPVVISLEPSLAFCNV